MSTFSTNLVKIMDKKKITINQINRYVNIKPSTLRSYINDKSCPTLENLRWLKTVLGCTYSDLLNDEKNEKDLLKKHCSLFYINLESLMKKFKINISTLAKKINVNESTISRYLADKIKPTLKTVLKLKEYFKCSTKDLLGD